MAPAVSAAPHGHVCKPTAGGPSPRPSCTRLRWLGPPAGTGLAAPEPAEDRGATRGAVLTQNELGPGPEARGRAGPSGWVSGSMVGRGLPRGTGPPLFTDRIGDTKRRTGRFAPGCRRGCRCRGACVPRGLRPQGPPIVRGPGPERFLQGDTPVCGRAARSWTSPAGAVRFGAAMAQRAGARVAAGRFLGGWGRPRSRGAGPGDGARGAQRSVGPGGTRARRPVQRGAPGGGGTSFTAKRPADGDDGRPCRTLTVTSWEAERTRPKPEKQCKKDGSVRQETGLSGGVGGPPARSGGRRRRSD